MGINPSRVVAFFVTPILSAGSLVGCAWLAKHFPGLPPLDPAQVTAFGIAGATVAAGACLKWLHGWSLWERLVHEYQVLAPAAGVAVNTVSPGAVKAVETEAEAAAKEGVAKVVAIIDNRKDAYPAPAPAPVEAAPAAAPEPTSPAA